MDVSYTQRFDWEDPTINSTGVELALLGDVSYRDRIREGYGDKSMSDIYIEREILRDGFKYWKRDIDRETVGINPFTGDRWHQHFARYCWLLVPGVELNTYMMDAYADLECLIFGHHPFEKGVPPDRKVLNLIGHANATKSTTQSLMLLGLVSVMPEHSRAGVACPHQKTAGFQYWGRITRFAEEIKKRHVDLFPDMDLKETLGQVVFENHKESGKIELMALDDVNKIRGCKTPTADDGFNIISTDETGVFKNTAYLDAQSNLMTNPNYLSFNGSNSINTDGMDGSLCYPQYSSYEELDIDETTFWTSNYQGMVRRYDGERCPNVQANATLRAEYEPMLRDSSSDPEEYARLIGEYQDKIRVIYPYLLGEDTRFSSAQTYTERGHGYLEQVRSFPDMATEAKFVLTKRFVEGGGCYLDPVWPANATLTRVAGIDPGFGGDPCVMGAAVFGECDVMTSKDEIVRMQVMAPLGKMRRVRLDSKMVADDAFMDRLNAVARSSVNLKRDESVPLTMQIAVAYAEFANKNDIPYSNCAYDWSMREGVMMDMNSVFGFQVPISLNFKGRPSREEDRERDGTTARERYENFTTELHFTLRSMVGSGQFRGVGTWDKALDELFKRRFMDKKGHHKKIAIQDKKEYRKIHHFSPDYSDTWLTILWAALNRGMSPMRSREAPRIKRNYFTPKVSMDDVFGSFSIAAPSRLSER